MKNILIIVCLCLSTGLFGQAEKDMIQAIQTENWDSALGLMPSRVDFCVNDDQDFLKKAETIDSLKAMIHEHGVKSWAVVHKGQSKSGNSSYSILESTTAAKPLRILVFAEEDGGTSLVSEIRLETK